MTEAERRRFEVLLEQVLHEVRVVAEGHETLRRDIDAFRASVDERSARHEELIRHVAESLREEMGELRSDLRRFERESRERDDALLAEIREVAVAVEGHEARISAVERKIARGG